MPAEVTFRTELAEGDVEALARGDALAVALGRLAREWLIAQQTRLGSKRPRVALHDPLTLATLLEPRLCPFESRGIRVDDHAATTVEPGRPNVEVAVDVNAAALRQHLMSTWLPHRDTRRASGAEPVR